MVNDWMKQAVSGEEMTRTLAAWTKAASAVFQAQKAIQKLESSMTFAAPRMGQGMSEVQKTSSSPTSAGGIAFNTGKNNSIDGIVKSSGSSWTDSFSQIGRYLSGSFSQITRGLQLSSGYFQTENSVNRVDPKSLQSVQTARESMQSSQPQVFSLFSGSLSGRTSKSSLRPIDDLPERVANRRSGMAPDSKRNSSTSPRVFRVDVNLTGTQNLEEAFKRVSQQTAEQMISQLMVRWVQVG